MKQYRYILSENLSLTQMVDTIQKLPEYLHGDAALLQIVEADCVAAPIQKDLDFLSDNLPNIQIVGMTSHGALSKATHSVKYTVCSILFFQKTSIHVNVFDCQNMLPSEAGKEYQKVLGTFTDTKAILMMSSDFSLCPEPFIDEINEFDSNLIVFGALAGTKKMGDDRSLIFVQNKIYERAILTVAFCGKDLNVMSQYNLGFRPLGKELTVTKADKTGVVYEINEKPAFEIYRHHLGAPMNDYFFDNTSSFPFMLHQNGNNLARVALDYNKDNGALLFAVEIPVGSAVSLGYATDRYLLEESRERAEEMNEFCPEAILIYACMSRRMLMGDDLAELEFDLYENVIPDATWAHGYGELLHAHGLRGFLNASLVAIGLREGEIPENFEVPAYKPVPAYEKFAEKNKNDSLPLAARLVNFLESTTEDLRSAVEQLFKVASLDELTNIYNRRALNFFLNQFIESLGSNGQIMVLMVDIDHFKHVNDTYGHDVGDIILKEGVEKVKAFVTQRDIIGRWGGEEFIMISPYSSEQKALEAAEMIRIGVANMIFDIVGHITISCGVTLVKPGDTVDSVFKRVDSALYEAKETGRNKVVFKP